MMFAKKFKHFINILVIATILLTIPYAEVKATGKVPDNCLNPINLNPAHDLACAPIEEGDPNNYCDGSCIYYCPTFDNHWAKLKIPEDIKNLKIRAPYRPGRNKALLRIIVKDSKGNIVIDQRPNNPVTVGSRTYITAEDKSGRIFHKGDIIYLKIIDYDDEAGSRADKGALGFRTPHPGTKFLCGEDNVAPTGAGTCPPPSIRCSRRVARCDPVKPVDYSFLLTGLDKEIILQKMCFADTPIGLSDFDFEDFAAVMYGDPVTPNPPAPVCNKLEVKDLGDLKYQLTCFVTDSTKCIFKANPSSQEITKNTDKSSGASSCTTTYQYKKGETIAPQCYAVSGNVKVTSDECKLRITPNQEPQCLDLDSKSLSGGIEKLKVKFICKVKDASTCKIYPYSGAAPINLTVSNGKCEYTYTYDKPGTYKATCYAVEGSAKNTSSKCTVTNEVKKKPKIEDTAGGILIPAAVGVGTSGALVYLFREPLLANLKKLKILYRKQND